MKFLILLIGLILISGCFEYECKQGEKIGDNCYTLPMKARIEGELTIYAGQILSPHDMIYEIDGEESVLHLTKSNCVIEELEVIDIDNFECNDTSITLNDNLWIEENDYKDKRISVSFYYDYRWRRTIWDTKKTSHPFCINEVRNSGGEVK